MRQLIALLLVMALVGCEDQYEDTYRYSHIITQSKTYPVYFDASQIDTIQVKESESLEKPFKILSNYNHIFVGDMLKGVHVYEKKAQKVSYLCFIECKYLKDMELSGSRLYMNNLVDLVVVDVSNPLQMILLDRRKNQFNRFSSYKTSWNLPYMEGKGFIVGNETHQLTGVVTEKKPELDFSDYDQIYGHLKTNDLPDNWFSDQPEYDRPYIGMVKVGIEQIYTYGTYNSWAICSYRTGILNVREEDLWASPRGAYAPPYYYSNAFPARVFFEDEMIFIQGKLDHQAKSYCDVILYNEEYPLSYAFYFPDFVVSDICFMPELNAFIILSGTSFWGVFISGDTQTGFIKTYKEYDTKTDATEIFRVGDQVVTLGDELSVWSVTPDEISLVKTYPDISGKCCLKEGSQLIVANTQGVFQYDITDLENIQAIP